MNHRLSACLQPLLPLEVTSLDSFERMISAWADNGTLPTAVELISSIARRVQRLPLSDGDSFKEPLGYFNFALMSASQALYILRDTILYFHLPLKDREQAILSIKLAVVIMAFYNPLPALIRSFIIRSNSEDVFDFSERLYDFFKRNDGCTLSLLRNSGCNDRDVSALALLIVCQDVSENIWRLIRAGGDNDLIPCIHSFITLNIRDYKEHYSGVTDAVHQAQTLVIQKELERRLASGPAGSASFTTVFAIAINTLFEEELSEYSGANHQEYVHFYEGEVFVTEKFFSLVHSKLKQLFPTIDWDRINSISGAVQCGIFELEPSGQMFTTRSDKKSDTDTGFVRSLRLINPQCYFAPNSEWFKKYQDHCSTLKKKMAKGRELPIISKQEIAEERATICTKEHRMADPVGPLTEKAMRENNFFSSLFLNVLREKSREDKKARMQKKNMRSSIFWATAKKNSEESEKRYKEEAAKYTTEIQLEAGKRLSEKLLPKKASSEQKSEPTSAEAEASSSNCPSSAPEEAKGKTDVVKTCAAKSSASVNAPASDAKLNAADSEEDKADVSGESSPCNASESQVEETEFPSILNRLSLSLKYLFAPSQDVVDQIANSCVRLKGESPTNYGSDSIDSDTENSIVCSSNGQSAASQSASQNAEAVSASAPKTSAEVRQTLSSPQSEVSADGLAAKVTQTELNSPVNAEKTDTRVVCKAAAETDKDIEASTQTKTSSPVPSECVTASMVSDKTPVDAAATGVSAKEQPAINPSNKDEDLYFDPVPQSLKGSARLEASDKAADTAASSEAVSKKTETTVSTLSSNDQMETTSLLKAKIDTPAASDSASDAQAISKNALAEDSELGEEYVSEDEEYNDEPDAVSGLSALGDEDQDEFSIELPSVYAEVDTGAEPENNCPQSFNTQESVDSDEKAFGFAHSKSAASSAGKSANAACSTAAQEAVKTSVIKSPSAPAKTKTAGASSKKTAASKTKSASGSQTASGAKTTKTSSAAAKTSSKTTKATSAAKSGSPSSKAKGTTGASRAKPAAASAKATAPSKTQSKAAASKPNSANKSAAAKKSTSAKKTGTSTKQTGVGNQKTASKKETEPKNQPRNQ